MALLAEPTIWIDGKLCMKGDKRVPVPDWGGAGRSPSTEDRVRAIWRSGEEAQFRPVKGFIVPIDKVNPLRTKLKGQVIVKVEDRWGIQVQELRIERNNAATPTWKIDVELLRKEGKSLPTKRL